MANTASSDRRRIGVIDLGSNTVLLLVLEEGGRVVTQDSVITRLGRGVFDMLWEQEVCGVAGIDSSAKAIKEPDVYQNLRAEMWFHTAAVFQAQYEQGGIISIPDDEEQIEDLTAMRYVVRSNGRIQIEDKKLFKKRMGRSPNRGDAFVYLMAEVPEEEPYEEAFWDPRDARRQWVNAEAG